MPGSSALLPAPGEGLRLRPCTILLLSGLNHPHVLLDQVPLLRRARHVEQRLDFCEGTPRPFCRRGGVKRDAWIPVSILTIWGGGRPPKRALKGTGAAGDCR